MRVQDFITKFVPRGIPLPSSLTSYGGDMSEWGNSMDEGRISISECRKFYMHPLVFAGINLNAQSFIGRGYFVDPADTPAGKLCRSAVSLSSFEPTLLAAITETLTSGDGFIESIWANKKKSIAKYVLIDAETVKPMINEKGITEKYLQKTAGFKKVDLEKDQVIHFRFWRIGDAKRGIGYVEPLVPILKIEQEITESIGEAVKRFSLPFFHVIKKGASDQEIKKMQTDFKNIERKSFFATSELYSIEIKSLYQKFPNLDYQCEYNLNKICAGLRVPKSILIAAAEAVNRATLEALIDYNQFEIMKVQSKISQIVEEQMFTPLCQNNGLDEIPELKWHPLMTEDERQKAEIRHLDIDSVLNTYRAELISQEQAADLIKQAFEGRLKE